MGLHTFVIGGLFVHVSTPLAFLVPTCCAAAAAGGDGGSGAAPAPSAQAWHTSLHRNF